MYAKIKHSAIKDIIRDENLIHIVEHIRAERHKRLLEIRRRFGKTHASKKN